MTLGGVVPIRNGNELDFCWRECIQSLLLVCDVVAVCDGQSTDGTQEEIREWMKREPKIVLSVWDWPNPKGNPDWYTDWLQYARMHTPAERVFQLDADEILSEASYDEVLSIKNTPGQFSIVCDRLNFWSDHRHLIPHGVCCAHQVVRIAPQNMWLASDGYDRRGEAVAQIARPSGIQIFHYGFIRKRSAFFAKERLLQGYYFNTYDPRLEKAETYKGNWATMPGVTDWENALIPFHGEHPAVMTNWLKERG